MTLKTINGLVSASNIFGIIPLYVAWRLEKTFELYLVIFAIIGSVLMHISERKHNLPGLFFAKYHRELLWLDRISSMSCVIYIICAVINRPCILATYGLILQATLAVACLYISEMDLSTTNEYAVTHIIWHCSAFIIFAQVIYRSRLAW